MIKWIPLLILMIILGKSSILVDKMTFKEKCNLDPITITFIISLIGAIFLFILILCKDPNEFKKIKEKSNRKIIKMLALSSILYTLSLIIYYYVLPKVDIGLMTLFQAIVGGALILWMSRAFLSEKMDKGKTYAFILYIVAGIVLYKYSIK